MLTLLVQTVKILAACFAGQVGYDLGKWLVTECLWPRIKLHFDYWRCFDDNIKGLRDEIGFLEREKCTVDQKIEDARRRSESPTTEVENWSKDSSEKLEEASMILHGCDDVKAWNIISWYSLGKRAKKSADGIAKLRITVNFIRISDPTPPSVMALAPISHKLDMEFDSRRRIEEDIVNYLSDDHTCTIAICGSGGTGKTTMVRRIEDRVRKENLFDEVVHVVVSQKIDLHKIQTEIAELLGLKFSESTLAGRAHRLNIRLLDSKRKLIIFDDVWKCFEMEEIGVPFDKCFTRCKIVLTSRVKDACKKMCVQEIIQMELLTYEEAWSLFKEKAGSYIEGPDLRPIAENVAAECKGLPLALVTVGLALKDQSLPVWRNALSQMRSFPEDFPEVLEGVYKPLKLSYDFLENQSLKSLFLLCCLFPEDYDIPIEHLAFYGIGLGMFKGIKNIEEGRSRTQNFVEKLKSRFLLINGGWRDEVKMHDIVRDLAIFICSKEKRVFSKSLEVSSMGSSSNNSSGNCTWMSENISIENAKLPVGSHFPNLCLIKILDYTSRYGNIDCLEGLKGLKVLSISGKNLRSLPPSLESLKKLRTLHLHHCAVKDISVFGEFASLEILCIHECHRIEELPADVARLNRLRLLELNECRKLQRILTGVISSLVELEELKIVNCFNIKWKAKGNQSEEKNASLSELESLPYLTSLEIYISDFDLFTQDIFFSQKLARYNINYFPSHSSNERKIRLCLPRYGTAGNWIRQLVRSSQSLTLQGDGSDNFNLAEIESLRDLIIENCSTVKKLVNTMDCEFPVLMHLKLIGLKELEEITYGTIPKGSNSFQKLESISVKNLPKLGNLWKSRNQNVSLCNLKSISIAKCHNLCYLFSVTTARSLVQLQCLVIEDCNKIEQVFWNERKSNMTIEFSKLQELTLSNLPNLETFSQALEIMEFLGQLTRLTIKNCPKLRTKTGKFLNLRFASLSNFKGPRHLLLSCRVIEHLFISNCDNIEEILWHEIKDDGERHITFPELMKLKLGNLPCLTTFCECVESIKFPKLKKMEIENLPGLNSLLPLDFESMHDHCSLHFFCNQMIEIPSLKELYLAELQDTISKIWCHYVRINFYHNLEVLHISDVNGIRNLISSPIAKNLVNLKCLCIRRCKEMVHVIEDEKEELTTTLFHNLERLSIESLHNLRTFCQWEHDFELPSLRYVNVRDCPGMETFTLGSIRTPQLLDFCINEEQVKMIDLNASIRDQPRKARFLTRRMIRTRTRTSR